MKLHKNLVQAIAQILSQIFKENFYADKAIERNFKQHSQWGSRDRKFISEAVYDIVRNYRLYETLSETKNNFWFLTGIWLVLKDYELPNWQEFQHIDKKRILFLLEKTKNQKAIYFSYPDWLWELAGKELGEQHWENLSQLLNLQAHVFLRTNELVTTRAKLKEELLKEETETIEMTDIPEALQLSKRKNIFQSKLFLQGKFEVQDYGSQKISRFLNPQSNHIVIDACAGAGGKSLHLVALMKNKGKLICLDVSEYKLKELKKRAKRASVQTIETKLIDNENSIAEFYNKADKLLLDVPCSGTGVIKRNPDTKWKLTEKSIEETKIIQERILQNYSKMIKLNGEMVYSTCSILPSENQNQIEKFLNQNSNFSLVKEETLTPSENNDGFYMALLKRIN